MRTSMKKYILMLFFINIFVLQGVAEAASISKRVRILESKVYKQNKKVKQQAKSQKQLTHRVNEGLQEIGELKFKIEDFIKNAERKKKKRIGVSEGYSFP